MSSKKLGAALAAVLLITACSGSPEPAESPAESPATDTTQEQTTQPADADTESDAGGVTDTDADSWNIDPTRKLAFVSQQNAVGVIEEMKEPADMAALRKRTEAEDTEVKYYRVSVDNRKGEEEVDLDGMVGFDAAGKEYTFVSLQDFLTAAMMSSELDQYEDDQYTLQDSISKMSDKYVKTVPKRGVADVVLMTMDLPLPDRFVELTITPYLFEEETVVHAEDIGDDDMLNFEVPEKHKR